MIKKGIIIFLALFINVAFGGVSDINNPKGKRDPWFGLDKLKHLSSSFVMTTTGYYVQAKIAGISNSNSINNAGIVTISLGLGKEISDSGKQGNIFSLRDLTFDIAGVGLAFLFIRTVE